MKKIYILLLAALACGTAVAQDNTLYFCDAMLMPGTSTNIEMRMRNTSADLTCLEAEIQFPEGLSAVLNESGDPAVTLYRNRSTQHEVLTNVLENGNLKVLISSIEGVVFNGEDGPLLSISVKADIDAPTGECTIETVGESLLVNTAATAYYNVGVTGNVMITDDPTGVNLNANENLNEEAIYNLAGQRVGKAKNGIFIKGGRKELHK
ncbi:MAG: hypothetical protein J6W03_00475 [Bacteroidaceae bacterium]|nr:hypothetical protein [Bacteroidaceae bacterium]